MPRLRPSIFHCCIYFVFCTYLGFNLWCDFDEFYLLWQVILDEMSHFGFADGASRHTWNLASVAWVLHYPSGQLLVSRGVCIGPTSNNVAECTTVVNLLSEEISLGVDSLVVFLDSQLVVLKLNNTYRVRDPFLHRLFFRVRLLQRSFQFITFIHIP